MAVDVSPLFEPLVVKGHTIPNRIVMPPMVGNRHIASDDGVQWYAEHAAGGVGLVIVEATAVNRFGDELTAENLKRLTDAIHEGGALAAIQLFPVTFGSARVPADLSPAEIEEVIGMYCDASKTCAEGGFDGVEPHGAHGFLLNQFFSPSNNDRTDNFGGSLENRMRMGLEVVRASREGLGAEKLLLYRHTPVQDGGYSLVESLAFAEELVPGGVDVLDISPASDQAPADRAAPFTKLGVPVIGVNHLDEVERALEALNEGRADLIAVGRGLIADPRWPQKVREGRHDEIVGCVRCDEMCFGNLRQGLPIECTQWESG